MSLDQSAPAPGELAPNHADVEVGMDEGSFDSAVKQAVADLGLEGEAAPDAGNEEDDNQPTPGEAEILDDDEDESEDEGDEEDAGEEDESGDDEDDEEGDGDEDDEGDDDSKLSKSAKERARIRRRAEEKVRKELTEKHQVEVKGLTDKLTQTQHAYRELESKSTDIEMAAEAMLDQIELFQKALGAERLQELQPHLQLIAKDYELRKAQATNQTHVAQQKQQQDAAAAARQQSAKLWVAEMEGMAKAKGLHPKRFLFEVRLEAEENPGTPFDAIAKTVLSRMTKKKGKRRGAASSDTNDEPPVRPLKGGGGSGGAPNFNVDLSKHELGSAELREELHAWLDAESVKDGKSR